MNMINKNSFLNSLLCSSSLKIPTFNSHYITGKNILLFKEFVCIEKSLSTLTCKLKNCYLNPRK